MNSPLTCLIYLNILQLMFQGRPTFIIQNNSRFISLVLKLFIEVSFLENSFLISLIVACTPEIFLFLFAVVGDNVGSRLCFVS